MSDMQEQMEALLLVQQEMISEYENDITMKPIFSIERDEKSDGWVFSLNAVKGKYDRVPIATMEFRNLCESREEYYGLAFAGVRYHVECIISFISDEISRVQLIVNFLKFEEGQSHNPVLGDIDNGKIILHNKIQALNGYVSSLNQVDIDYFASLNLPDAPW